MTTRQRKQMLMVGAVAACTAGLVLLGRALALPVVVPMPAVRNDKLAASFNATGQSKAGGVALPTIDQLHALAGIDLRRPLVDPPAVQPEQPAVVLLSAQLVGTANEQDRSVAIFTLADGTLAFCGTGQQFDDPAGQVTVKHIDGQRVTIEYAGTTQDLVTPQ